MIGSVADNCCGNPVSCRYCIITYDNVEAHCIHGCSLLTHLSRMSFPISISRVSLFQSLGVLDGMCHFYSNSYRTFREETVEIMIRRRVLWRQIWVCDMCLCHIKRRLIWANLERSRLWYYIQQLNNNI